MNGWTYQVDEFDKPSTLHETTYLFYEGISFDLDHYVLYVLVCALYVVICYVDLLFVLSRMWLLWIVYLAYSQRVETLSLESSLRYQRIPKWYQAITSVFKERKDYLESKRKPIGIIGSIIILRSGIERKYIYLNRSCRVNSCCEVLAEFSLLTRVLIACYFEVSL